MSANCKAIPYTINQFYTDLNFLISIGHENFIYFLFFCNLEKIAINEFNWLNSKASWSYDSYCRHLNLVPNKNCNF